MSLLSRRVADVRALVLLRAPTPDDERPPDEEKEQRKKLSRRETAHGPGRIGFAEHLTDDPQGRVENKEHAGDDAARHAGASTQKPQGSE